MSATVADSDVCPVGDLPDGLTLVTDQCEIRRTLEHIGSEESFGCLFVDTAHGSYSEVWGVESAVPYNANLARRVL